VYGPCKPKSVNNAIMLLAWWYPIGPGRMHRSGHRHHHWRDIRSILDAHYLHRDPALAESAICKLGRRTKTPN
jgi:hypothetical protein